MEGNILEDVLSYLINIKRPFVLSIRKDFYQELLTSETTKRYVESLISLYKNLKMQCKPQTPKKRGRPRKKAVISGDDDSVVNLSKSDEEVTSIPISKPYQTKAKIRTNRSMAELTVRYFNEARNLRSNIITKDSSHDEAMLYNVITSSTLTFCKILTKYPERLNKEENVNSDTEEVNYAGLNFTDETDSALYKLGGGCLGEILSRTLKSSVNVKHAINKRLADHKLQKVGLLIKMNSVEKESLPLDLQIRDNGKMNYPKTVFLDFIRTLNQNVREHANKAALMKYGSKMIKKCAEECFAFIQREEQKTTFHAALPEGFNWEELGIDNFYKEWTRKMIHARMQEFISSSRKKGKGGQTLRDQLYGFKEKSAKVRSIGKSSTSKDKNKTSQSTSASGTSKNLVTSPLTTMPSHAAEHESLKESPRKPTKVRRVKTIVPNLVSRNSTKASTSKESNKPSRSKAKRARSTSSDNLVTLPSLPSPTASHAVKHESLEEHPRKQTKVRKGQKMFLI